MPAQFDYISGFDPSSLASITQAQLLQMVNQLSPLSDIGGVVCMDGIAAGAAGTGFPDIGANPRFARYIWLDTNPSGILPVNRTAPVFKRYIGIYAGGPSNPSAASNLYTDWEVLGVANGSITTAMMRAIGAQGGIDISLIKRASDGAADVTKRYYILRIDSAGRYVEIVSLDTAIADGGGVGLNRLISTGIAAQKYLKAILSGTSYILGYGYFDPSNDINAALGNRIVAGTSLAPGGNRYILRTNEAGQVEFANPNTANLFAAGDLTTDFIMALNCLAVGGAVTNDYLRFDGTNWSAQTPKQDIVNGILSYDPGTLLSNATRFVETAALATAPKLMRGAIKCIIADGVFGVGDEIGIEGISNWNGATHDRAFSLIWRASTSKLRLSFLPGGTDNRAVVIAGAADQVLTLANWAYKLYYWL